MNTKRCGFLERTLGMYCIDELDKLFPVGTTGPHSAKDNSSNFKGMHAFDKTSCWSFDK